MKPPFVLPSMADIAATPWNGYRAISTFSGAGGSSLGLRMAGYRVIWASEFVPAASEVYRLNNPDTPLDYRDIRTVSAADVLEAIGMEAGELDLLDGSPPCSAFSTAGKISKKWGEVSDYSDTAQRVDDLFYEFVRLVDGIRPRVFIAENVSGLVKGQSKGYFKMILAAMKACGYNVKVRLVNAKWLGVPQRRERLFFVGVRDDLGLEPAFPQPQNYFYDMRDAVGDLPQDTANKIRMTPAAQRVWEQTPRGAHMAKGSLKVRGKNIFFTHYRLSWNRTYPTVLAHGGGAYYHPDVPYKITIQELKRFHTLPDDFKLIGSFAQQWERIGRSVPPRMMYHLGKTIQERILDAIV